jgi:hypothetical protein
LGRKLSRTKNLDSLPRQAQWLALSVSAHRTQAIGRQLDGYTILLQPQADSIDPTSNKEIEIETDVDVDSANENATTALDGPRRSAAADHHHDIAMTEDPRPDADVESKAEAGNTENGRGANTDVNVDIDVDMPDPQAPLQRSNKQSAKTRSGFQRYLCAEYVDSLTL